MKKQDSPNSKIRGEILKNFERFLGERGYKETTIQQIADVCGISKGHITFYFRKKEDFLPALFANYYARIEITMNKIKLKENPMVLFFMKQLFNFYILEKKEDYYRKVSELSEVTMHLDARAEKIYNDISSGMKKMDIQFDPHLLETSSVSLSYAVNGLVGYWYRKEYPMDHMYFFDFFSNFFLCQGNFGELKQYKEKALKIFKELDKEKLLQIYDSLSEYDYAK